VKCAASEVYHKEGSWHVKKCKWKTTLLHKIKFKKFSELVLTVHGLSYIITNFSQNNMKEVGTALNLTSTFLGLNIHFFPSLLRVYNGMVMRYIVHWDIERKLCNSFDNTLIYLYMCWGEMFYDRYYVFMHLISCFICVL